jgi:FkbM family methyltransferase
MTTVSDEYPKYQDSNIIMDKILKILSCYQYPGKYRLYKILKNTELLSGSVRHKVGPYYCIVPADQFYFWKIGGPQKYQIKRLTYFARILNTINDEFTFFDLGADVGSVSIQMKRLCPKINKIIAVEPNRRSFTYLSRNLSLLEIPTQSIRAAASNFDGISRFSCNVLENSDHSGHLDDAKGEEVDVIRLDSIYNGEACNIALKIDVEGAEKFVLEGAQRILSKCHFVGIFIEIHYGVIERTKIKAEEIFGEAERIRPFSWYVAEQGLPKVDRSRGFFEQFPKNRQYDVIGIAVRE